MRRSLITLALLLACAGAWWLLRPRPAPPHVLLVTIDTLRADAVTPADMPALSALAERGMRCSRARTPVPLTLAAHATILSGFDPPRHGLRDNTAPPLPGPEQRDYRLLAEEFKEAGYAAAAFVASSVLGSRYRLDAGFDEYREPTATAAGEPAFQVLDGAEQVKRFRAWFAARPQDRPFFAWVHLWEPHAPYRPYDGDEKRAATAASDPPAERYAGEVRKADALVEQLLELVDPATTVVVVTSDHGEALGQHGEATHGHLCYGATMDAPLIVAGPGVPRIDVAGPAALADVAPTLRRLCGLARRPSDGLDLLDPPAERVVPGESLYANRLYGWAQQAVACDGRYTLIDAGPRLELFDGAQDPGETSPLPEPTRHVAYERLDRALQRYRAAGGGAGGSELTTAGSPYGSLRRPVSSFLPPAENRRLRDVRSSLPDAALVERVTAAIAAGNAGLLGRLLPPLRRLVETDPGNPGACLALGRALLLVLDDPHGAVAALEEARRRGYASPGLDRLLETARSRARR